MSSHALQASSADGSFKDSIYRSAAASADKRPKVPRRKVVIIGDSCSGKNNLMKFMSAINTETELH